MRFFFNYNRSLRGGTNAQCSKRKNGKFETSGTRDINQQSTDKFVTFSMMRINLPLPDAPITRRPFFPPPLPLRPTHLRAPDIFFPPPPPPPGSPRDEIDRDRAHSGAVDCRNNGGGGGGGPVATEIRGNSARFYRKAVVLISARPKIADEANERWFVAVDVRKIAMPTTTTIIQSRAPTRLSFSPRRRTRARGFSISFINP